MNTSQFMDKQVMDLTSSSPTHSLSSSPPPPSAAASQSAKDFLDLMNPPQDNATDHHNHNHNHRPHQQPQHTTHNNSTASPYNGIKSDEILSNYDFQPLRSLDSTPARTWNSADSKPATKNSGVLVSSGLETGDVNGDLLGEIDRVLKKHVDDLVHVLDGVSARLTQLESRTRQLESSVDELKVAVGNNHGSSDGKMRQLENILREVQNGVHVLKDKQEVVEAQLQLAKLQVPKADQKQSETQNTGHMDTMQEAASAPPQSHQQHPPVMFPQSAPPAPISLPIAAPPPPNPQPNVPTPAPIPSQFPQHQIPPVPQREPYYSPPGQSPELPNPQYQAPATQMPQPSPAAPSQQPYQPAPQLQYSQPPHQPQHQNQPQHQPQPQLQPQPQPQPQPLSQPHPHPHPHRQLGHHSEETSYIPAQMYPPNQHPPSSQPPSGAPPSQSQSYYGTPPHLYEPASSRPNSGFSTGFASSQGPTEPYPYAGSPSHYGSGPTVKPQQLSTPAMSQGGGGAYPQLPIARVLPQALPTASGVGAAPGSPGTGNRVPIDDVIDKLTNMGFPRDHVRATVRKLTDNGQQVDLNTVLDRLMNDGEFQPQRGGWFGR